MAFVVPALAAIGGGSAAAGGAVAASAALGAVSALRQSQAAGNAADFNSKVARNQALFHRQNAELARRQASLQARKEDRLTRLRLGSIKAAAGASGGSQVGSVLDVLGDAAEQGELERQNALFEGEISARGHEMSSASELATSRLEKSRASGARTGGFLRAAGALAGGVSQGLTLGG